MRKGGGKAKGSAYEREICKLLSRWVSHGKHDDLFWRSAMSGGRATVAKKKGVDIRQTGDICSVSPEGHALTNLFYLECKFYRDLQIDSFIFEDRGKLAEFWRVAKSHARDHKLSPMLIAKQNGRKPLVIVRPGRMETICNINVDSFTTGPCIWFLDDMLKSKFRGGTNGR